jgi:NFU1 iron-sulfur cluster scaffold homolog, mitochondrial
VVRDPDLPLVVSDEARERLAALGPDHGVHVDTIPMGTDDAARGHIVRVTEGPILGPPPPSLEPLAITASDPDLQRLRGRTLAYRSGRWMVEVHLELRAKDTPNPSSRLYLADQLFARGRPLFFVPGPDLPDLAALLLGVPGVKNVLLRDNTVTVERTADRGDWDLLDRSIDSALRTWLLSGGRPIEGGADSVSRDPLEAEIWKVLEERVLPAIHRDGGTLELVGFRHGVVLVSMQGACKTCPSSAATLRMGVEQTLRKAFPGQVERVEAV